MSRDSTPDYINWPKEQLKAIMTDKTWWVFVLHGPFDPQAPPKFKDLLEVWWQVEEGSVRHRQHLQGVCRFKYPKSRAQLREQAPAWWQPMHGTPEQAVRYCTKEKTRVSGPFHFSKGTPYFSTLDAIVHQAERTTLRVRTPLTGPLNKTQTTRPWVDVVTGF